MTRLVGATGVLAISFAAVFVRLADTSPATVTFFRTLYALPMLGVIWLVVRGDDHRPARARWGAFAAGTVLAIDLEFFHLAIGDIGAGLGTVLANTQVVFVGVIAWLVYRERPTRVALIGIPAVFAGVVLISGLGRSDTYGNDPVAGVIWGVASGIAYATFILGLRASNRAHLAPSAGPVLDATAGAALGGLVIGLLFEDGFSFAITWPTHGWLLALAAVAQVFGWLLITNALPRLPALETGLLILMQPVGTILWARLIFGEALSATQWLGVGIVLTGIVVLTTRGVVRRDAEAPGSSREPQNVPSGRSNAVRAPGSGET